MPEDAFRYSTLTFCPVSTAAVFHTHVPLFIRHLEPPEREWFTKRDCVLRDFRFRPLRIGKRTPHSKASSRYDHHLRATLAVAKDLARLATRFSGRGRCRSKVGCRFGRPGYTGIVDRVQGLRTRRWLHSGRTRCVPSRPTC